MPDASDFRFGLMDDTEVTCIACGDTVSRASAREYDKHGDRWDRDGKSFEYLCKPCYREECHYPRGDLEERLVRAGAGETDLRTFLARYCDGRTDRTVSGDR